MNPTISIVVPALDEEATIAATLERLRAPEIREVIVADGGSADRTRAISAPLADRVLEAPRGRASQMNAGAAAASGDVLLFVHADTLVPAGFAAAIVRALAAPEVVGGRFDVELDDPGGLYRMVGTAISLRSRWNRLSTGDQAMFVRREVFARLGGFPDQPLMEDLALSIALRREGRIACLRERVTTSARRWRERGVVRTILVMWTIRSLYAAGISPRMLARFYANVR